MPAAPRLHPTAFVASGARLIGDVTLEAEASVWYNAVLRGDLAAIVLGTQSNIQDNCVVHVDEGVPCRIGPRVGVGHGAILHGCEIEDDCLVGMGAIVLNRAHLGRGSVIGAGALVPEGMVVPPGSLVLGVPGRVVRTVDAELARRIERTWRSYIDLAQRHRAGDFGT
jgi:carbonic anhydrase/acetyltransferase-like protein (isoleucine patch superfamily)